MALLPDDEKELRRSVIREMFDDPQLSSREMQTVDALLTKILRESDEETRKELLTLIRRWEMRVLFIDAVQEARDAVRK